MRKIALLSAAVLCGISMNAQVVIPNTTTTWLYANNFNTLQTQSNVSMPMSIPNWQIAEYGTGNYVNYEYRGGNGSDPSGEIYSFGQVGSSDRALGSVASGTPSSLEAHYGVSFINNTGTTITSFYVGFRQEQWRVGDADTATKDSVRVYYSTDADSVGDLSATWIEVPSLMMESTVLDSTGSGSTLNGNLYSVNKGGVIGLNLPQNGTLWIKFVDHDNPGVDDGLAIDNFYAHVGNCSPAASFTTQNASCYGVNDGLIEIEAWGGQPPYQYSIDYGPFQSGNVFNAVSGGTAHFVQIKESGNNCIASTNIPILQPDSIPVSFGVTPSSCMDSNGTAWADVTGTNGPYTLSWNTTPVQTTDTAVNVPNGPVTVLITDGDGCSRTDTLNVPLIPLFVGEEICSITVDSTANKNLLVWDKTAPPGSVDKYYIYRADSNAGNYALLDSVDYTAMSTYLDNSSSPSTNYYSYYITTVKEDCGESPGSAAHTEKRLLGTWAGGNFVLNWNDYIGVSGVDSQYVYYSYNGAPFTLLNTVPITQIGDAHFAPPAGYYRYFVGIPNTGGCNPQAK
ncbi:MAG: SprB repeat-containing protein, partial [Flavipsychrobacter sp.]|nr:SprB repeat-containing protein [Flavipsychrobacter sp.]